MQGGNDPNSVPSDSLDGDELALFEADQGNSRFTAPLDGSYNP
jgi:hypothetical protein